MFVYNVWRMFVVCATTKQGRYAQKTMCISNSGYMFAILRVWALAYHNATPLQACFANRLSCMIPLSWKSYCRVYRPDKSIIELMYVIPVLRHCYSVH